MQTIQDELARIFADRELNRIDQLRVCSEARRQGLTQMEIARYLSISQPEVHRILRRIENFPALLDRTPREVILDFHAERIGHEEMMQTLKGWPYTFSSDAEPANPLGALTGGSWDDITDAVQRDLIDLEDYQEIVQAVHPTAA
ncbi:MarR family transcriptional regulator [Specibacter cremeus]|uniref:MarR family transcriptional regulator n=1 Tax=Specibacter cremeus TaxID=1629051 RepID=UPI000F77D6AF|nr:MarR family transcriptional regulator [Specibacter cremeus]